ncbi:MAG TPA: ATP-binding protein [Candidatus Polarisedimenticolaceae bacterium]|nr:ATP-binding protein [Candidatus Polarisedimenticolaceae bacterium]
MTGPSRAGRFETQLRLVLVLTVVFLAVLDLSNVLLLTRTRDDAERAERERAKARGREVVRVLGPEALVKGEGSRGTLARTARDFDLARIALWDASGRETAASRDGAFRNVPFGTLDADEVAALRAGRAVASDMTPRSGGEAAAIDAYVPVLDASGRLAAVVDVEQAVPELGALQGSFRVLIAVQAAAVVLIAVLALLFGRWVSRPYKDLAAAAGEAGLAARSVAPVAEPGDLAAAFRAVADKLREQDGALEAMARGGGGLGDLVRFVANSAAGMSTGVAVLGRDGRLAAANPAATALLGLPEGSARGRDLSGVPRGMKRLSEMVERCMAEGRSVSREVLELRPEGGRATHLGVTISPVAGLKGDVHGALVLMTDLTEIREVEEQVSLREHLAAVGRLSAGIAHEFRNALGTILGWARMLEKRDDPRVHGPAKEILKEVDAVRAQIDEFLLYARPPEPQRASVDLEALLRSCVEHPPAGIDVVLQGEFGRVVGDEALLRRVFGNLLQNAADIGEDAGRRLLVRIAGRKTPAAVQIEIDDDGPGIPPDKRGQIFVPFFTTRERGTGLGLALVQRTVVDHGGTVEAAEGPRGGAMFRLRFPAEPAVHRVRYEPATGNPCGGP